MVEIIVRIARELRREIVTIDDAKEFFGVEEWSIDSLGKELEKIMGEEELKKLTEKAYKLGFEYEKNYGKTRRTLSKLNSSRHCDLSNLIELLSNNIINVIM